MPRNSRFILNINVYYCDAVSSYWIGRDHVIQLGFGGDHVIQLEVGGDQVIQLGFGGDHVIQLEVGGDQVIQLGVGRDHVIRFHKCIFSSIVWHALRKSTCFNSMC